MEAAHIGVFRSRKYLPPSYTKNTLGWLHRQIHIRHRLQLGLNWSLWYPSKNLFLLPSSSTTRPLRNLDWDLWNKRSKNFLETATDIALLNAITITNNERNFKLSQKINLTVPCEVWRQPQRQTRKYKHFPSLSWTPSPISSLWEVELL